MTSEVRKEKEWVSLIWFDAVFAATSKARVLRVAHALFKACDSNTGTTWSGRDRIQALSRIDDLDNFRKIVKELQTMGALEVLPLEAMPEPMMAAALKAGKSPEGVWYRLNIAWARNVLRTEKQDEEPVDLTADRKDSGQTDRVDPVKLTGDARSNRPPEPGRFDPPYLPLGSSHRFSPYLPGDEQLGQEGKRKSATTQQEAQEAIHQALLSGDCAPLLHVVWKNNTSLFDAAFGPGAYQYWDAGETVAGRRERFESLIGGKENSYVRITA